jgi:hypothetical protein
MPRGSKPGERRGGRQRGTPNKATIAKAAALKRASSDPNVTPLQFLLGIMRDDDAPTDLRVRVAQIAAPLVHEKPGKASSNAAGVNQTMGQNEPAINLSQAKTLRDIERRLSTLSRKRYAPSENGGALTESERREESDLRARHIDIAQAIPCPPAYSYRNAREDNDRLHQLHCKRLSPPSTGGDELSGADDDEEAILTARVASYRHSSEGRDLKRIQELESQRICGDLNEHGQKELDELTRKCPNRNANSELASAIRDKLMQLRE